MEIQLFNSPIFGDVRTITNANGEPLFLGSDVAKALGYSNPAKAVATHCKSNGITNWEVIDNLGRTQQAKFINEGNLYRLIARSNLPEAERFESWIFDEVVPSVRKTGGYIPVAPEETPQETLSRAFLIATETIKQRDQRIQMLEGENRMLLKENKELAPKAEYTDRVLMAPGNYTHSEMAKELGFRSWKAFVDACNENGILYKAPGGTYMTYAKYSGKGYTTTRTAVYNTASGDAKDTYTVWTEEGRRFLHEFFGVEMQPVDLTMFRFPETDF